MLATILPSSTHAFDAAAATAPVPVVWANSTVSPATDLNCTSVANTTTPEECECGRLAAFFTEAEVSTFDYVVSTIVQRLDPKRTSVMTGNATQQACHPPGRVHFSLELMTGLLH